LQAPGTVAANISFSGYPGSPVSIDDYFTTDTLCVLFFFSSCFLDVGFVLIFLQHGDGNYHPQL
jgi:hypothetical protein